MNRNKVKNRNLISRFSSSLLGRGKKSEGHKVFFNVLLILKVNVERKLLDLNLQQDILKTSISNTNFVYFLRSMGFHENILQKAFPKNEKVFHVINKDYSTSILPSKEHCENRKPVFPERSRNPKSSSLKPSTIVESALQQESTKDAKNIIKQQSTKQENQCYIPSTQAFSSKSLCKTSISNVKPILETRKIRKGRITYRIPLVTRTERQEGKAISWLVASACSRKKKLKNRESVSFLGTSIALSLEKPIVKENSLSTIGEKATPVKATLSTASINEKPIALNFKQVKGVFGLIENKKKDFRSLQFCLAESFLEAFQEKGESVEKRKEFHQLALQNRAYTHYRWW